MLRVEHARVQLALTIPGQHGILFEKDYKEKCFLIWSVQTVLYEKNIHPCPAEIVSGSDCLSPVSPHGIVLGRYGDR